jgi:hypothetical protein
VGVAALLLLLPVNYFIIGRSPPEEFRARTPAIADMVVDGQPFDCLAPTNPRPLRPVVPVHAAVSHYPFHAHVLAHGLIFSLFTGTTHDRAPVPV